jgi:DNA polymerase elongation subunit (family B)
MIANIVSTNKLNLPEEFNLHRYIDYNKMWDKVFIKPISSLLECIGYDYKQRNTLDNFYDG